MVSDRSFKVSPPSITTMEGKEETLEVSFERFNVFDDAASTDPSLYTWSFETWPEDGSEPEVIENNPGMNTAGGVVAENSIASVTIKTLQDPDDSSKTYDAAVLYGASVGKVVLVVTDKLTGAQVKVNVEIKEIGSIRAEAISVKDKDGSNKRAEYQEAKTAYDRGYLDSDEIQIDNTDPDNPVYRLVGLDGVYAVYVELADNETTATVYVKSFVSNDKPGATTGDKIKLCDKAGNELGTKTEITSGRMVGYYEFKNVPVSGRALDSYYIYFDNDGDQSSTPDENGLHKNEYHGKYKLAVKWRSTDATLKYIQVVDFYDNDASAVDYTKDHGAYPAATALEAKQIGETNDWYVIIDDDDPAQDANQPRTIYVRAEAVGTAEIRVDGKIVNVDHQDGAENAAQSKHDANFDIQSVIIEKADRVKEVSVTVFAESGDPEGYKLYIYKKSEATTPSSIQVIHKDEEGKDAEIYTAYTVDDPFTYEVIIPETIDVVDLLTKGNIDNEDITNVNYTVNTTGGYQTFQTTGRYENLALTGSLDTASIQLSVNGINGVSYTLNIRRMSDEEDPVIYADSQKLARVKAETSGYDGMYEYAVAAGTKKVKLTAATVEAGAKVKIDVFQASQTRRQLRIRTLRFR